MLLEEGTTETIIGAAIRVHTALGPGLLESAYEACLCHALAGHGVGFQRQLPIPVVFEGMRVDCGFRADLVVENKVIVELKSVDKVKPVHEAQLLTYLKLSGLRVGLLLNFNVTRLPLGIVRRVL